MPAKSEAQRKLMAIARHSPSKLYKRNIGVLKMSEQSLKDFATGIKKKLPYKVSKKKSAGK